MKLKENIIALVLTVGCASYIGFKFYNTNMHLLIFSGVVFFASIGVIWVQHSKKKNINTKYKWLVNAPSIITTIGICCTFIGVTIGLIDYNPSNADSLNKLLDGLKVAFVPSAYAIICSIAFKWWATVEEPDDDSDSQVNARLETLEKNLTELIQKHGVASLGNHIEIPNLPQDVKDFISHFDKIQHPINVQINIDDNQGNGLTIDDINKINSLENKQVTISVDGFNESLEQLNQVNNKEVTVSVSGLTESLASLNQIDDKTVNISVSGFNESLEQLNQVNNKEVTVSVSGLTESLASLNQINDKTVNISVSGFNESLEQLNKVNNKEVTVSVSGFSDSLASLNQINDKTVTVSVSGFNESLEQLNKVNNKEVTVSVSGFSESLSSLNQINDKAVNVSVSGVNESLEQLNKVNNKEVTVSVSGLTESLALLNQIDDKTVHVSINDTDYKKKMEELNKMTDKKIILLTDSEVKDTLKKVLEDKITGSTNQAELDDKLARLMNSKITGNIDLDEFKKEFIGYLSNSPSDYKNNSYLNTISSKLDKLIHSQVA